MTGILHLTEMVGMAVASLLVTAAIVVLLVVRKRSMPGSPPFVAFDTHQLELLSGSTISSAEGATRRGGMDTPLPDAVSQLISTRLQETRAMADKAKSRAHWSGFADVLLTTGDYVVGGVLTTSFAQHELPSFLVGGLGLVVLISSMAQQLFHPERIKVHAARKAAQLRKLARETEEMRLVVENAPSGKARIEIIQRLSQELAAIELAEEELFSSHTSSKRDSARRK
jgi:hypothetical protein